MPTDFSYLNEPDPFAPDALRAPLAPQTPSVIFPSAHAGPASLESLAPEVTDMQADASDAVVTAMAEYDAAQRAQALAVGGPTERTLTPGVVPQPPATADGRNAEELPFVFIWIDKASDKVLFTENEHAAAPQRMNINVLYDLLNERDVRLVVPDKATVRRLQQASATATRRAGESELGLRTRSVERQLEVLSRITYSTFLIVLTRALERKYWLPEGFPIGNIDSWASAFEVPLLADSGPKTMSTLLELASRGSEYKQATNAMFYGERQALNAAKYGGLRPANTAFLAAERVETGAEAWDRLDLGLLDRNLLDGSVCEVTVDDVDPPAFAFNASLSQPFRLKVQKNLLLFSDDPAERQLVVTLETVRTSEDGLSGYLMAASPTPRSKLAAVMLANAYKAMQEDQPLYATEQPYFPVSKRSATAPEGRWASNEPMEFIPRSGGIPIEVSLAAM
ncbi:hypothetical protein V5R04_07355 [Jonesiaceae bacterium BS-20]|uniref:Uncharacterized protein n=1 Tax=Jonesiaceae bacterium BS-20 TaxID=3120821 RepID=A0AAU7DZ85_9MICO